MLAKFYHLFLSFLSFALNAILICNFFGFKIKFEYTIFTINMATASILLFELNAALRPLVEQWSQCMGFNWYWYLIDGNDLNIKIHM